MTNHPIRRIAAFIDCMLSGMPTYCVHGALWLGFCVSWHAAAPAFLGLALAIPLRLVAWMVAGCPDNELDAALAAGDREHTAREEAEKRAAALANFKRFVHGRLDEAGVPADPDPDGNAEHGCRISGRLNWVLERMRP